MDYQQRTKVQGSEEVDEYSDPSWEEEEERTPPEPQELTMNMIKISKEIRIGRNQRSPSDWIPEDWVPFSGWATRWERYREMPTPSGEETMEEAWRRWIGKTQDRIEQRERYEREEIERKKKEWRMRPRMDITREQWLETARTNWRESQKRYEEIEEKNFWGWAEINYRRWTEGWRP
jgi:hypothetical protein